MNQVHIKEKTGFHASGHLSHYLFQPVGCRTGQSSGHPVRKPYPLTVEGELRVRKWLFFHKTFAVDYQDKIDLKNIQL